MTNPTQPKPTPLPAILVYGTPSSPALAQASWFRAEDKEAVKAAAEALKFSVIELQTDAEQALTAGVHEGVLKGSGRMIEQNTNKRNPAPLPTGPVLASAPTPWETLRVGARVLTAYWNEKREFEGFWLAPSSGSNTANPRSNGSTRRHIRRSRARRGMSRSRTQSSASRASSAEKLPRKLNGAACGSPFFFPRAAGTRRAPSPQT